MKMKMKMNKCTWKGCSENAIKEQLDKNGKIWANLCDNHHDKLNNVINDPKKIKKILSYWVKAQGGAEVATRRTING